MSETIHANEITNAIAKVEGEVIAANNPKDLEYFLYHEKRFERMAQSIVKSVPRGGKILDIGSHYLHSSMVLTQLGYKVFAVDVSAFWEIDFIKARMADFDIEGIPENDLESFESVAEMPNTYDVVLFTEILEHITFNPVNFWRKVYGTLRDNGLIYLSTPNSLALPSLLRSSRNLLMLRGVGIKVSDIFSHVTYGHHWKEFSRTEIKTYFGMLSDDFDVCTNFFIFHKRVAGKGVRDWLWQSLIFIGHWLYYFSPTIEAIIKVNKGKGFKIDSPGYH
tara:strand:+ start:9784 stop:10617 length:834 start_codon:yes stop_codon:yes gene_type:complete